MASIVWVLVSAAPAPAAHDTDSHSPNADLVASLPVGPLGDIAFWGDLAIASRFVFDDALAHGFSVVDVSEPRRPREVSRFGCTGAGWDVSVWEHLVFLSADRWSPTVGGECDAEPGEGFFGIKIVSIADPARPVQVGAVQTPCIGSHTNTLVPDLDHREDGRPSPRVVLYASSLRFKEQVEESGCDAVVEVPLAAPEKARVVGSLPGDTLEGCHDTTAFLPRELLAGACGDLRLFDISDPAAPRLLSSTRNPISVFGEHSVIFSSDGTSLVSGEEDAFYDSGDASACPGGTPAPAGALWFWDVSEPSRPLVRSYHQLPRGLEVPTEHETGCSAHNFNVIPTRDERDIVVAAWYAGGMSAIDFTELATPKEIAHYQPDADDPGRRPFYWSAYWYRDHVYATSSDATDRRALDVFRIRDPLVGDPYRLPYLNAQTQETLRDAPPAGAGTPAAAPPREPAIAPGDAARRCRPAPRRLRVRRARVILRADLLRRQRRVRRLRISGRIVSLNLRSLPEGSYVVRVGYRDRRGRLRTLRRRVTHCG